VGYCVFNEADPILFWASQSRWGAGFDKVLGFEGLGVLMASVGCCVVDEADCMFGMGFAEQLGRVRCSCLAWSVDITG
jgi:hypothetical protein